MHDMALTVQETRDCTMCRVIRTSLSFNICSRPQLFHRPAFPLDPEQSGTKGAELHQALRYAKFLIASFDSSLPGVFIHVAMSLLSVCLERSGEIKLQSDVVERTRNRTWPC